MHEYCENALLKLHQPMILQNHISMSLKIFYDYDSNIYCSICVQMTL